MKRGAGSGVIQRFLAFLDYHTLTGQSVGVAFSGGPDSTALAICASEARNAGRLTPVLVHVDHGVRPGRPDRVFVQQTAQVLELELRTVNLTLIASSSEAEMREARYAALSETLLPFGITRVMTGHHAMDQAETVLLHLARGEGLEGASGMSPIETLTFGSHVLAVGRPFLREDPGTLRDLVAEYQLRVVQDPTNASLDHARNLVRHQVIPVLSRINSAAVSNIARSAEILRWENDALEHLTLAWMADNAERDTIDGQLLGSLAPAIQRRVLRAWVEAKIGLALSFDRTESLRKLADTGRGDAKVELGEGWSARQVRRRITLHRDDA